jgi:hypothetical protein
VERGDEEFDAEAPDVDLAATVVVSTGDGTRFHRPGDPLFVTACRTAFDSPTSGFPSRRPSARGSPPAGRPRASAPRGGSYGPLVGTVHRADARFI